MKIGTGGWVLRGMLGLGLLGLDACAMVGVSHVDTPDYVSQRRADVIVADRPSDRTVQSLNVVALTPDSCQREFAACTDTVARSAGLTDEQRLSALAELWLGRALKAERSRRGKAMDDATLDAFLQSARYAYAYLFYTARTPAERAFEWRQVQVTGFYNLAVQRAMSRFFLELPRLDPHWTQTTLAGWSVLRPHSDVRLADGTRVPAELIPAANLRFDGLRNVYRRDGFGSDFVAVAPAGTADAAVPWREPDYVPVTGALVFDGSTLAQLLATRQVSVLVRDPYHDDTVAVGGRAVPLGANFTAPYGVWLARSGFARQSIRSLLGREGGLKTPRVLLMQPYDPDRLTVVMLHGLASSPEAWINVANEVMGDEELRRHYQVWEVYYPTNLPVAVNLASIRKALDATLQHYDPSGQARASRDMVLIGHSMGGVIARLLVSSSGDRLWGVIPARANLSAKKRQRLQQRLAPYLQFSPMPQVTRAVFLAAPHRGTPYARHRLARWLGELIRLPVAVLKEMADIADLLKSDDAGGGPPLRVSNSIDNLGDSDPFIVAAADLPIAPQVRYHSIIGVYRSKGALRDSNDGLVPYSSAHLAGADSELVIPSWHSVQETPAAILELRRILRLQLAALKKVD
ncbi:alpha/beta fold hydrolase [Rhodanobacter denitrificans]|uniref:alpha/beta fold hydrolase n=1 Tax=Rhodanobacter denitrificans TaxID=666685 RepID=UPI001F2EA4CA|nr:alpha/beta fold hydrolase [Rhodanobacter denitrificans]UJM91291.1 alpha/beta fold hydrolase [Rhodanobacter denitrificans]